MNLCQLCGLPCDVPCVLNTWTHVHRACGDRAAFYLRDATVRARYLETRDSDFPPTLADLAAWHHEASAPGRLACFARAATRFLRGLWLGVYFRGREVWRHGGGAWWEASPFRPLVMSARDLEFLALQQWNHDAIVAAFTIPSHLLVVSTFSLPARPMRMDLTASTLKARMMGHFLQHFGLGPQAWCPKCLGPAGMDASADGREGVLVCLDCSFEARIRRTP